MDVPILIAWVGYAIGCAAAVRIAVAWAARRYLHWDRLPAAFLAYGAMVVLVIASGFLHAAVFGEPAIYGPDNGRSLTIYLLAPFGLPLVVGGFLFLFLDGGVAGANLIRKRSAP